MECDVCGTTVLSLVQSARCVKCKMQVCKDCIPHEKDCRGKVPRPPLTGRKRAMREAYIEGLRRVIRHG